MKTVLLTHGAGGVELNPTIRRMHLWRAGKTVGLSRDYLFGSPKGTEVTDDDARLLEAGSDAFGGRRFKVLRAASKAKAVPEKASAPAPAVTPQEVVDNG